MKERLHELVDTLPASEAETAARVLEALHAVPAALYTLEDAPLDDQAYTEKSGPP